MGNTNLESSTWSAAGGAGGLLLLYLLETKVLASHGVTCVCPSLAATATLLFCLPTSQPAQPRNVIGGHILAALVAFLIVRAEISYSPEILAVGATILGMRLLDIVHPPAGAYAYYFVAQKLSVEGILAPGLLGAVALLGVQRAINELKVHVKL